MRIDLQVVDAVPHLSCLDKLRRRGVLVGRLHGSADLEFRAVVAVPGCVNQLFVVAQEF